MSCFGGSGGGRDGQQRGSANGRAIPCMHEIIITLPKWLRPVVIVSEWWCVFRCRGCHSSPVLGCWSTREKKTLPGAVNLTTKTPPSRPRPRTTSTQHPTNTSAGYQYGRLQYRPGVPCPVGRDQHPCFMRPVSIGWPWTRYMQCILIIADGPARAPGCSGKVKKKNESEKRRRSERAGWVNIAGSSKRSPGRAHVCGCCLAVCSELITAIRDNHFNQSCG